MVTDLIYPSLAMLLAQEAQQPLLKQLDPPRRAIVLMALLGLVVLGIAMVACVMIGGHWVRRLGRSRPTPSRHVTANSQAQWRSDLAKIVPEVEPGDTAVVDQSTDDTVTD